MSSPWLSRQLIEEPWSDPEERLEALIGQLPARAKQAWQDFRHERPRQLIDSIRGSSPGGMAARFGNSIDETIDLECGVAKPSDEEKAEAAANDASLLLEQYRQDFLDVLTPEQREQFLAIDGAREEQPWLDPSIMQRYILWRVFDLGWTVERFGRFDLHINTRGGRDSHKPERIGKKYQWIAYHEILAYLSDHHQFDSGYSDDPSRYRFNGPWQLHGRDIDPTAVTHLRTRAESGKDKRSIWWQSYEFDEWRPDLATREWLDLKLDEQELVQLLQVADPQDGSKWLNLRALRSWRDPSWTGSENDPEDRRQVWIHANAYFVDARKADEFYQWARQVNFMGRWMPEPKHETSIFLGEHSWSPAFLDRQGMDTNTVVQTRPETPDCPTSVYLTAFEYLNESGDYDCSLQNSHTFVVPERMLIEGMDLRWGGGDSDYFDADEHLGAFASDPSGSTTSLLVREDLIRQFLERERLALVWTVVGEKELIGGQGARRWTGSLRFTGAYRFNAAQNEDNEIDGGLRFDWQFPEEGVGNRGP